MSSALRSRREADGSEGEDNGDSAHYHHYKPIVAGKANMRRQVSGAKQIPRT